MPTRKAPAELFANFLLTPFVACENFNELQLPMPTATRRRINRKKNAGRVMPSREMRVLKAEMAMKHVSLADVSRISGINYHTLSAMLNGRVTRPQHLPALRAALASFANP